MSENVHCGRCGRRLKNPKYVEIGYGKICLMKLDLEMSGKPLEVETDPEKIGHDLAQKFKK